MNLQLLSTRATKISLDKNIAKSKANTNDELKRLEMQLSNAFTEDESKTFLVIFNIKIEVDDNMLLEVAYEAEFELDNVVTDEFKNSSIPVVNAPAIAYPFARAFISNTLLNSGYEPVLLPSINFVTLHQKRREQSK
ncbi:protein-export chaperone SecB [Vibrio alginolyticus]|uniref:protein-export chaperone SecB n=1 Tax=Vibrio alginolyticus TaxID=663 RepID=UPI0029958902|nr:protein-export chaperone SecB [Vibrio parahaemolyticus]